MKARRSVVPIGTRSRTRYWSSTKVIARLKAAAMGGENVLAVLMDAARVCPLGRVTEAFFEVDGHYWRKV